MMDRVCPAGSTEPLGVNPVLFWSGTELIVHCFTTPVALQCHLASRLRPGSSVGFVPTMGALHRGHQSLMGRARTENSLVVVSIFVNPLQFGPAEDLGNYPRPLDADKALCAIAGVDILFVPTPQSLYGPSGDDPLRQLTQVRPPLAMTAGLCGRSRPGHFEGVATVVAKLLNIVRPDRSYFGQKDAQQLAIIRRLALDLNLPGEIIGCPIVREASGLAFSSRNAYLSSDERDQASVLFQGLSQAEQTFHQGEQRAEPLKSAVIARVQSAPKVRLEYVELVDPISLEPLDKIEEVGLLAIAAQVGTARLIDNVLLSQPRSIIAIDGPAGAGKSTVTRQIASLLGLRYLDTGAMYRTLTWLVLEAGIELNDEAAVAELMATSDLHFDFPRLVHGATSDEPLTRVWVNSQEVTQEIRSPRVSQHVSAIAAQRRVREHLVEQQRRYGREGNIVAEGRDIGTTVFPEAELKIFLTATNHERAKRRLADLAQQGQALPTLTDLEQQIAERDRQDSTRAVSPLKKAEDAIEILTDGLTIEQVTERIVSLYRELKRQN